LKHTPNPSQEGNVFTVPKLREVIVSPLGRGLMGWVLEI